MEREKDKTHIKSLKSDKKLAFWLSKYKPINTQSPITKYFE
jgi:hypothetical protein